MSKKDDNYPVKKDIRSEYVNKNLNIFAGVLFFNCITILLLIKELIPILLGFVIFMAGFVLMIGEVQSKVTLFNNKLSYRGMILKGEADINQVAKIVTRKKGTYKTGLFNPRDLFVKDTDLVMYLLDKDDNVLLSFPENMIIIEQRSEFTQQLQIVNREIMID